MVYRLVAALLLVSLIWGQAGGMASAEDTITGVELSSIPSNTVYVNEDAISLTLWATVNGSSTKKDVTSLATWTSSNSAVSVNGGVVTAKSNANSVVITGKYGGYTATATVKSVYRYGSLEIRKDGTATGSKLSANMGDTLKLTVYGNATAGTSAESQYVTDDANWSSSNTSVATVDGGQVTLVGPGTTTISASYLGRTASVSLTVDTPYKSLTLAQSVNGTVSEIPGTIEGYVDDELQLRLTAELKSGGVSEVTSEADWSSSNTAVATVDDKGLVSFVGVGTTSIKASYQGVTKTVSVIVRTPYEALRTTPDKSLTLTMQSGRAEVTAYVLKNAQSQEPVTTLAEWTSSNVLVATIDQVGSQMYITPKSAGTTTVKVTYKGLTRGITVVVLPTVSSLKVDKDSLDTFAGETGSFPAVSGVTLSGDTTDLSSYVQWTSDNPAIIAVQDGKWKALATGSAKLTATLPDSKGADGQPLSASVTVNVNRKIHMLVADTDSVSIIAGKDVDYPTLRVVYADGGQDELVQDKVSWKSSSASVLVTDSKWRGLVAAKATMTGTYLNQTVKVQAVVEDEYVSYTIDPTSIDLTLKQSKTVKVTGKTKSGKKVSLGSRIQWTASDESVVDVNGASVKALAEGSGKLTATFQGKELSVPYTVKAKLTKLTASPSVVDLKPGAKESVKITAVYENGKTVDATASADWSLSSSKVATVYKGTVTAVAKGSTTVKASFGGKTVTVRVKVTN